MHIAQQVKVLQIDKLKENSQSYHFYRFPMEEAGFQDRGSCCCMELWLVKLVQLNTL